MILDSLKAAHTRIYLSEHPEKAIQTTLLSVSGIPERKRDDALITEMLSLYSSDALSNVFFAHLTNIFFTHRETVMELKRSWFCKTILADENISQESKSKLVQMLEGDLSAPDAPASLKRIYAILTEKGIRNKFIKIVNYKEDPESANLFVLMDRETRSTVKGYFSSGSIEKIANDLSEAARRSGLPADKYALSNFIDENGYLNEEGCENF